MGEFSSVAEAVRVTLLSSMLDAASVKDSGASVSPATGATGSGDVASASM